MNKRTYQRMLEKRMNQREKNGMLRSVKWCCRHNQVILWEQSYACYFAKQPIQEKHQAGLVGNPMGAAQKKRQPSICKDEEGWPSSHVVWAGLGETAPFSIFNDGLDVWPNEEQPEFECPYWAVLPLTSWGTSATGLGEG